MIQRVSAQPRRNAIQYELHFSLIFGILDFTF